MQTIYIDVSNKNSLPRLYFKQSDNYRRFMVVLVDQGLPFRVPEGSVFSIWYNSPSGDGNYSEVDGDVAVSVDQYRLTVLVDNAMTSAEGDGVLSLIMHGADGVRVGLWNIDFTVENVPSLEEAVHEPYYEALLETADRAANFAAEAQAAADKFNTDTTLSKFGKAADAGATGKKFEKLIDHLNVQSGRIDNFIASETPADDSELRDIRVGYDGTKYRSAGEAVRKQVEAAVRNTSKDLWVTVSDLDTNDVIANKTYEEISEAVYSGQTVICYAEDYGIYLNLASDLGEQIVFIGNLQNVEYTLIFEENEIRFGEREIASLDNLPKELPNPQMLIFTGAVEAGYDGSEEIEINIPDISHKRFFDISEDGVVSLKPDYRGSGKSSYPESVGNGTQAAFPDHLVIPDTIDGIQVTALAPGMFYGNTRVNEVTIPDTVTAIPEAFCMYATNLKAVSNTAHVTSIGSKAFAATRIKQVFFPNLTEMGTMAFASCGYLEIVDIGNIPEIPERAFADCAFLREVSGGENVTSIGPMAFYHTHKLRDLPLLAHVTSVADYAFFFSRICTSLPAGGEIGTKAFPTVDNTTDFWTGVPYTPCQNRITTKLSQRNPKWVGKPFLKEDDRGYGAGCALFCVMHIHSAITGKYYSDPREFVAELDASDALKQFLYYNNWPGLFTNVSRMFDALGYRTEVHGLADGDDLTAADYKALVDALAAGAYVYSQAGAYDEWQNDYFDGGHSVVLYGINELGEVCVLDSAIRHEPFRESGFEPDADVYTYTMPYQNLVGASSNFVIVYPPKVKPPQYKLVQRLELTEELNSVSIDCNLEKFVLYANAPIGATGANGTLRVYKNNSSEEVYSLWMTSVVAAGGERNMAVTGENKQGIAFISVIPPNSPTSESRTATHNASYIEGVTPFTKIQVSLVSDNVYPVGSVFELWGIPGNT